MYLWQAAGLSDNRDLVMSLWQAAGLSSTEFLWTGGGDVDVEGTYVWSTGETLASTFEKWKTAKFPTNKASRDNIVVNKDGFIDVGASWVRDTRPGGVLCEIPLPGGYIYTSMPRCGTTSS